MRTIATASVLTCGVVLVAATGCSIAQQPKNDVSISAPNATATALPDGVPIVAGAELAADPKQNSSGQVSGWSAVALAPAEKPTKSVATELAGMLTNAGWRVTSRNSGDSVIIDAQRISGTQNQWLAITVTAPVPQGGPAISYRFATGPAAAVTPS